MKSMMIPASLMALTLAASAGVGLAGTQQGEAVHTAMTPSPSFDQVDANKDGSISLEEASAAKALENTRFESADQNGDGKLSKAEYAAAVKPHDRQGG
ncbi:MAG: hypothetical protein IPK65_05245 [Gammaproteobacteria bacterium]|nr:hypothetical protein [Gammaproteobacteria bacterium]